MPCCFSSLGPVAQETTAAAENDAKKKPKQVQAEQFFCKYSLFHQGTLYKLHYQKSSFHHRTGVILGDCFPPFLSYFYLQSLFHSLSTKCYLWIPISNSFTRPVVHMGLNHRLNILKNTPFYFVISFQTLVEMSKKRVQLTPGSYRCNCLVCNAFILVIMKLPLTCISGNGSRVKARVSI